MTRLIPFLGLCLLIAPLATVPPLAYGKKKVNPDEFTTTAEVTEVTSEKQTTGYHNTVASSCSNPKGSFQKGYCAATPNNSYAYTETDYVMVTTIGDVVYQLSGSRLELGTYKVKKDGDGYRFLLKDKKGKDVAPYYEIVGMKKK